MQLKALIINEARKKNISAQLVMQNYMLERLLERISLSSYRNNFIIKGGFLISAIVGLDTRTTMDLDTTIKGFALTHESIRKIFQDICAIQINDYIQFEIINISDIRKIDDYSGIRITLKANYLPISVPLTIDVTTGDIITPREIEFSFPLLFDDRKISVLSYNIETILAEKIETVLSRSIANTRIRDYYDIYILHMLYSEKLDKVALFQAIKQTVQKRGSNTILTDYLDIINKVCNSNEINKLWKNYCDKYEYAKDISFDKTCDAVKAIMDSIFI